MFNRKKNGCLIILILLIMQLLSGCVAGSSEDIGEITRQPTETVVPVEQNVQKADETEAKHLPQNITGTLEIAILDVGQGDSIYFILPNGESMLIDAGEFSESRSIIQSIKDNNDKGVIEYIIATHPHEDHIGGMSEVIKTFTVKNIWMPKKSHTTQTFENLLDTIAEKGLKINEAKAGKTIFDFGNLKAEFVAPNGSEYSDLNNYSAVVRLTYNDRHFLFMGDAESESESDILRSGYDISADVIKIGHHGSSSSSTKSFMQKVKPKYAVISCGKGNQYKHPTDATLATLSELGIDVKRTDEQGIVVFFCDGDKISFTTIQNEIQPRAPTTPQPETKVETAPNSANSAAVNDNNYYIGNKNTKKFHYPSCHTLPAEKNQVIFDNRNSAVNAGYTPCGNCKP